MVINIIMIFEFIQAALKHAKYEIIDDEDPFYAEIPKLPGVLASGISFEACRETLIEALEGWILVKIKNGQEIPVIDNYSIKLPREIIN